MKRILAAMLTALMLLALLPLAAPARAEFDFSIYCTVSYAYVGETFVWYVTNEQGVSPYDYYFEVYQGNQVVYESGWSRYNYIYYTPSSPGRYKVAVYVEDNSGDKQSKYGGEITVKASPNKITKVEPLGSTSVKITWNKVPGATMYYLYRSTSPNTGWTWIKTTSGTSFSNTYLKAGTRYFYRVQYYREGLEGGDFSPVASCVPMAKTSITGITSPAKGQARLVWSKAAGASGYQVLMATSPNGTYKSVRILNGTTVTFFGMKSGSSFYFKVRPYRRVYTTTYWGQYSPQRVVKVK